MITTVIVKNDRINPKLAQVVLLSGKTIVDYTEGGHTPAELERALDFFEVKYPEIASIVREDHRFGI